MKIAFISTNIGSTKDGIGMYTYNLMKEMRKNNQVEVFEITGRTEDLRGIKKLISLEILKAIIFFINEYKKLKNEKINFIIEYPFLEWSLFSILGILIIKLYFKKSKLILSIHEYERVNFLRRIVTNILIIISDEYLVTDSKLYEKLNKKNKVILRGIPSNIDKVVAEGKIDRDENSYCYFGLINKSKAFNEMIEGWKNFNIERKYILNIYTSSEVNASDGERYNIVIQKNLSNEKLSLEFQKNKFMILPIKPYIDENNGTLKAAALHGCIPIGIFKEKLKKLGIEFEVREYSAENFYKVLINSRVIEDGEKIKKLKEYSQNFNFGGIVEEIMNIVT